MTTLSTKLRRIHFWEIATIILFVLLILSINDRLDFDVGAKSKQEVGEDVLEFINTNIFRGQVQGELVDVTEEYGLYSVKLMVRGQELNPYATKDGKILFPQGIDMVEALLDDSPTPTGGATAQADIPKSDKPAIDLFVMSQCPYGTIAEKAIDPVLDLLGDKVEFNLYFIADQMGEDGFRSLHGQPEVDENIRQLCVSEKYSRDVLMDYLLCVAEDYRNVANIWEKCASDNEVDVDEIKECFDGEGKTLFSENIKVASERGVGGSPTLMINEQTYSGARTADGYKEGVCSGFNEAPDECEETLSSDSAAATGSC